MGHQLIYSIVRKRTIWEKNSSMETTILYPTIFYSDVFTSEGWEGWQRGVNKWLPRPPITQNWFIPCQRSEKGVSKFNWKKKSTYPHIWCQRICRSVRLWHHLDSVLGWSQIFNTKIATQSCTIATQISPLLNLINMIGCTLMLKRKAQIVPQLTKYQ